MPAKNSIFPWWIPRISERTFRRIVWSGFAFLAVLGTFALIRSLLLS